MMPPGSPPTCRAPEASCRASSVSWPATSAGACRCTEFSRTHVLPPPAASIPGSRGIYVGRAAADVIGGEAEARTPFPPSRDASARGSGTPPAEAQISPILNVPAHRPRSHDQVYVSPYVTFAPAGAALSRLHLFLRPQGSHRESVVAALYQAKKLGCRNH